LRRVGQRVKSASRLVSVGVARLAKASSEGWRLRLRPNTDPTLKGALDVIRIANEAINEAVDRLLHEAIEKVLKEDD
jgi:hypothetical protein